MKSIISLIIGFFVGGIIGFLVVWGGGIEQSSEEIAIDDSDTIEVNNEHGAMSGAMGAMTGSLEGKSGDDFDKTFIDEMIVHHEGAVVMAQLAKQYAGHIEIKELADAIIAAQTKEIQQMQQWRDDWFSTPQRDIVFIRSLEKQGSNISARVDAAVIYGGEEAIEVAMKETNCIRDAVVSCAASLNNGFYISNPDSREQTYRIDGNTKISIQENAKSGDIESRDIFLDEFYQLWNTRPEWFVAENPFTIIVDNDKVVALSMLYIP